MKYWILILPVIVLGSTRQTLVRRIERVSGYIIDCQAFVGKLRIEIGKKQGLFAEMACPSIDLSTTEIDTSERWARQMLTAMRRDDFMDHWRSFPRDQKMLHCVVLRDSIRSRSGKLERRVASLEILKLLKSSYEESAESFDLKGEIDSKWKPVLEMAELYERYERGVRAISTQLHEFLVSKSVQEKVGRMFWEPTETKTVVRDVVDSIMRDEEDAEKLKLCLEMVLESKTMTRLYLHGFVMRLLEAYKTRTTVIGNDLLNAERALLGRVV